jgi:hypothetical protein
LLSDPGFDARSQGREMLRSRPFTGIDEQFDNSGKPNVPADFRQDTLGERFDSIARGIQQL